VTKIRIVLCRPSHPGNIGAAARAMKTMGITDLRLVAPEKFPAKEAEWMATNAADVLASAKVHGSLAEAIEDCVAAYALSARPREWSPATLDLRAAAQAARALDGDVAFVFGNEQAGLTNEEMFACQYLVHIPASAEFSSLNLAQAVQVVAYELFMQTHPTVPAGLSQKLATVADREGLYGHLHEASVQSGFHVPETGSKLPERLRRLFSRVPDLEREEVNIVRGLLKALLKRK
jgi:tRNA/rRNA methyltransferase